MLWCATDWASEERIESPVEKPKKGLHPERDDKGILLMWKEAVMATESPES